MRERKFYKVGITSGDPFGIGPEIVLKSLNLFKGKKFKFILYGDSSYMHLLAKKLKIEVPKNLEIKDIYRIRKIPLSHPSKEGGRHALDSLISAIQDLKHREIQVLITSPVSKKGMELNGIKFKGHTEFLAKKFGLREDDVVMTFFSPFIKVALLTTHIPLKNVYRFIKRELIEKKIKILIKGYESLFSYIPKIAILSLNPHKGENGKEEKVIEEVVREYRFVHGPFSPDSFFARGMYKNFEITFALYHDQGLIPFKMISKGKGCNVTIGLPFLRVSPDHGPAYEIAKKNMADVSSIMYCLKFISGIVKF